MWVCNKCNYENSDNYNFCNNCGGPKSIASDKPSGKTWVCNKCKTENWNNDQYCKRCRTPRNAKAEPSRNKNIILYGIIAALVVLVVFFAIPKESKPSPTTPQSPAAPAVVSTPAPTPRPTPEPTQAPVIENDPMPWPGPSDHDLESIGAYIEYPKDDEYYDQHYSATIEAPSGKSVWAFYKTGTNELDKHFNIPVGDRVVVLAYKEERGLMCVISESLGLAGWVNEDYVVFD